MPELSILIPVIDDVRVLAEILPQIHSAISLLSVDYELLVVANAEDEQSLKSTLKNEEKLVSLIDLNYGLALQTGFRMATGDFVLVVEPDHKDPDSILPALWAARNDAEILIASRYVSGGSAHMPIIRRVLSSLLNLVFSRGLDLRIRDMSSGFRLYKSSLIRKLDLQSKDKAILQEALTKALIEGFHVAEIPFAYKSRSANTDIRNLLQFGISYLRTFAKLWRLRNSIAAADYDARAYDSFVIPQRYWQHQRYKHIKRMSAGQGKCLDVGCGSSRIMETLPPGSLALDILMRKLRYSRRYGHALVQGSIFTLPVPSAEYTSVICSQVIEHVPRDNALDELDRVLQAGGLLILGTPDYAKWQWVLIEKWYKILLPQAYADEHITHYTYEELIGEFVEKRGYLLEASRYILQGEMILALRKPAI